jgi:hypothetical protein
LDKQLKLACHFNRFALRKTAGIKGEIEMQKTRKSRSLVLMSLTYMVCIVILSISTVAFAAVPADQMKKVEFIHKSVYSDLIHLNDAESLQWDVDGGRKPSSGMERVWGWSTCKDGQGTNVYHYTVAQYETITGQARASSGRIWGTGKVWAYSDWVSLDNALVLKARVYYGL